MASLQRIRSHGALLLIIVGLAMLAFILGDFFSSGSSYFNRSREYVGEIAGEDIHITDFENAREQLTEVYKIESGRNDFDEQTQANINNQVWQMMLMDYALSAQAKEIGMTVTADELSELCIGENPHQLIRQRRAFYDQSGQFNRLALVQFLSSLEQAASNPEQAANVKQAKTYWLYWENAVRLTHLQEKYTQLVSQLVGVNNIDATANYNDGQVKVTANYVMQPYYAVADSLVKVSNSEIKSLYNKKKEQYKQEPNRNLSYIAFDIVPSEQDFQQTETWINNLKEEFTTTDDLAALVNSNSDRLFDGRNYSEETVPEQYKEFAFSKTAKAGDVTEVLFENNIYSMARLVECGYKLPDSVQLRYTVLAEADKLDSLTAAWKKGEFGDASELGWLKETDMPKEMAEKAFADAKNSIFSLPYGTGLQVVQIMDKSAATPKVKLAIMEREVTPSSKTYGILYNQAKQYIVNNNTADKFVEAAAEQGLAVRPAYNIQKNANTVADLKQSRPIVRWAFKANEGDVSDVFECGEQFVVVLLDEVHDGEYRSLANVSAELRQELLKDKKAELIMKEMAGITSLEQAAEQFDQEVKTAEDINLNSYRFGNQGAEPAVIGAAVALEQNQLSAPVKGQNGVYLLVQTAKTMDEGEVDLKSQIQQMSSRYQYTLPYQVINFIEEKAKVVDNRANFY